MVKGRGVNKKPKASDHIDFESDNEELRDEVDKFHDSDRQVNASSYRRKQAGSTKEILNVEGDNSEEESEDDNDSSDFDDDVDEGVTGNQWGRKRKDYYETGFVDEDWGGMREEEIEDAELEEQDALGRQKELDKAAGHVADLFDDEEGQGTEGKGEQVVKESEFVWKLSNVKKLNRKTSELIEEYKRRKDLMSVIVEPLAPVVAALPKDVNLRKQILLVIDVYSSYLMNIMYYLKLKSDSLSAKEPTSESLDAHPVSQEISRLRKMIEKVDSFLEKNSRPLRKLMTMVEQGVELTSSITLEKSADKKKSKVAKSSDVLDEQDVDDGATGEEGAGLDPDGKRLAPSAIAKNAVTNKTKKKKDRHAKVANRRRYKEISKRVRSQVGKVRKEVEKYSGEARGIRVSTIKSTKLVA